MKKLTLTSVAALTALVLAGCGGGGSSSSSGGTNSGGDGNSVSNAVSGNTAVRILDDAGNPVGNASVSRPDGAVWSTDDNGWVGMDIPSGTEQFDIIIDKEGFVKQRRTVNLANGGNRSVEAMLKPQQMAGTIDGSTGGTASLSTGASVTVPANAFVDAAGLPYGDEISVYITEANFADNPLEAAAFSSEFDAVREDGSTTNIASLGMADFNFYGEDGGELELATGQRAEIRIPLQIDPTSSTAQAAFASLDSELLASGEQTLPAWYYDYDQGSWVEEGSGQLVQSETGSWDFVVEVSHFTPWNCDDAPVTAPVETIVECTVVENNAENQPEETSKPAQSAVIDWYAGSIGWVNNYSWRPNDQGVSTGEAPVGQVCAKAKEIQCEEGGAVTESEQTCINVSEEGNTNNDMLNDGTGVNRLVLKAISPE